MERIPVSSHGFTFTFESLPHKSKQHLSAEVTEGGRFVRVHGKCVRPNLHLL
jgi:hypothetical protein